MPSRACSVCNNTIAIASNNWKFVHSGMPLFCSKGCLVKEIQSRTLNGNERTYLRTSDYVCMGEGDFYSSKCSIYFRSRYEKVVAEFLAEENIHFEYEPYCFKVGKHIYVPDFYIPYNDCFLEVKGYFGLGSKSKLSKFLSLYPDVNLIMIPWTVRKELNY